jgi:hypothetical protein
MVEVRVRGVEAGLDEVKNSVGMNHVLRNVRLVESSCGI